MVKPKVPAGDPRIILGGGIGAGKSMVAGILRDLGAVTISADRLGHAVYEPGGTVYGEVAARWPSVVVDGRIDRSRLAEIVFRDPAELAALEALTHPAVVDEIGRRVAGIEGPVVVEVPVMLSLGDGWLRVLVDAGVRLRVARAAARGDDEADVQRRAAVQSDRETWLEWADEVIVNEGTEEALVAHVHALWRRLVAQ